MSELESVNWTVLGKAESTYVETGLTVVALPANIFVTENLVWIPDDGNKPEESMSVKFT